MQAFSPSSSHWEQLKLNGASTHKRFWILILWKVVRCSSKRIFPGLRAFNAKKAFFFTYCCRLPLSASRLDHLAKHFIAVQRDVVGLLDGLLCHLLAVHVELDFLWRDGDVELQEGEDGERTQLTKHSRLLDPSLLPTLLQHNYLAKSTKNTGAFQKLGLAILFGSGMIALLNR